MAFSRKETLTLEQGLSYLYELEEEEQAQVEDIYMEPPDPRVDTDEDSAGEDEGGLVDNLTGYQLRAPVEIKFSNNNRITENKFTQYSESPSLVHGTATSLPSTSISSSPMPPVTPTSKSVSSAVPSPLSPPSPALPVIDNFIAQNEAWVQKRKSRKKIVTKWIDGDFDVKIDNFPAEDYSAHSNMTPVNIFELFLNDNIINYLVEETKKYALFKNLPEPKVTYEEMKCFIAILFLTRYNTVPSRKNYWENEPDTRNEFICQSMRRDRFLQIMKFIHCADNTKMDTRDKVWKLRPLMDMVKERFSANFAPTKNLNYDESMIKYYGKHGCKQFIHNKPIRFGYKVWSLNCSYGYLVNFDFYQGKNPQSKENYDVVFGKCSAAMIRLIEELPHQKRELPYNLFMDNLFTCPNLLSFLRFRGYSGTGTVREKRIGNTFPLTTKKKFCKDRWRGDFEQILEKNYGILYVTWMDNAAVTVASTAFGTNPIKMVSRYSKAERKNILVPRPRLIGTYNNCMGGTDLMDKNISQYWIAIRGKKWWWPIFTWLLDACMSNAWLLYQKSHEDYMPQIVFKREIVKIWLKQYGTTAKISGRPATSISSLSDNRISDDIRYDRTDHYVVPTTEKKQRRCAGEGCCSSVRTMCEKCGVGLCLECFKIFHTKTYGR